MKYMLTTSELGGLVGKTDREVETEIERDDLIFLSRMKRGVSPNVVREYLKKTGFDYQFKVISHLNMRGGIGKTTTTITTAARASQYGFKTCILDLDPQGSSSLAFNMMPADDEPIFYDVWQNPSSILMSSLKNIGEYFDILPSSLENSLLDLSLVNPGSQKKAVSGVCVELRANGFDLVLIDCPPSLGTAVISSICASDIIVIPVCSDSFSFKGLELTLKEITSICDTFNLRLPDIKILYTRFDRREKISIEALNRLSSEYGDYLVPVIIRTSTEFSRSLEKRETVFASHRKNIAKDDYDNYVRYLLFDNFLKEGGAYEK